MHSAEYLYPYDLQITETVLKNILLIGSCLSWAYEDKFSKINPALNIDYLVFNNASDLPENPPKDPKIYDLQFIQIPLRSVLNDAVVKTTNFNSENFSAEIIANAQAAIDAMVDASLAYNKKFSLLTFVSNFFVPQKRISPSFSDHFTGIDLSNIVEILNSYLAQSVARYENAFISDINGIANSVGKRYFSDDVISFTTHNGALEKVWVEREALPFWTAPDKGRIEDVPPMDDFYDTKLDDFFSAVYRSLVVGYRVSKQTDQVKVVIFDLDNTLWRGQIAEHYRNDQDSWPPTDEWPIGIWEAIHQLRWRGILVSICSKNDLDVVVSNWSNAIRPAFLELNDFVSPKINWKPKAENIADILESLGLTAKSAVFVDDNPVERAAVKEQFPEIRVIGSNPFLTRRILLWSGETQVLKLTHESNNREAMVKKQIERNNERSTTSRENFLRDLLCKVNFYQLNDRNSPQFTRCLELLNKTNQFNTTGVRWTSTELNEFIENKGEIFYFTVKDKFVEYGLVGLALIKSNNIVQFVMSCRVLGMDIEYAVIRQIVMLYTNSLNDNNVFARLTHTPANMPCRELYLKSGFSLTEGDLENYYFDKSKPLLNTDHVDFTLHTNIDQTNLENLYLERYPDVQAAVARGEFHSGKDHFKKFGAKEGRVWEK